MLRSYPFIQHSKTITPVCVCVWTAQTLKSLSDKIVTKTLKDISRHLGGIIYRLLLPFRKLFYWIVRWLFCTMNRKKQ